MYKATYSGSMLLMVVNFMCAELHLKIPKHPVNVTVMNCLLRQPGSYYLCLESCENGVLLIPYF